MKCSKSSPKLCLNKETLNDLDLRSATGGIAENHLGNIRGRLRLTEKSLDYYCPDETEMIIVNPFQ